jgi:hypothetical protein
MTDTQHSSQQNNQDQGAAERARMAASDATRRAAQAAEANPLGVVAGGLALGAIAGALLPRSDKEKQLLAPVGKKLGEGARAAIAAAKEAGRSELETRGFTAEAGREQAKNLVGGLGKALSSAGTAGVKAARGQADQQSSGGQQTTGGMESGGGLGSSGFQSGAGQPAY